jgi:hypothetical protein
VRRRKQKKKKKNTEATLLSSRLPSIEETTFSLTDRREEALGDKGAGTHNFRPSIKRRKKILLFCGSDNLLHLRVWNVLAIGKRGYS